MSQHTLNKTCGQCAVLDSATGICALTGRKIDPDADFCSEWTNSVDTCDICGRQFIGPGTITEVDGQYKLTCSGCDDGMGQCRTCINRQKGYCAFRDASYKPEIPIVITQQVQKGPMVMQAQVPNPEREKAICPSCNCWKEDFGCCREAHTCGNYKTNWK